MKTHITSVKKRKIYILINREGIYEGKSRFKVTARKEERDVEGKS